MISPEEEDKYIKSRIGFKEFYIKKMANKYKELQTKFNSLTRNEIQFFANEIISELENIQIQLHKAETFFDMKKLDEDNNSKGLDCILQELKYTNKDISENLTINLDEEKKNRAFNASCEDIAKLCNNKPNTSILDKEIQLLESENKVIENEANVLNEKMNNQGKRIGMILKLIEEINSSNELAIN